MVEEEETPANVKGHRTDAYATKAVGKLEQLAEKKDQKKGDHGKDKKPAGGYDDTKIPQRPPGYTVKITFVRANNLPFADIPSFSSDPFIVATISTSLPKRHKQDPNIQWRTTTIRRNTNPEWNESWIIANIPGDGFKLKARIYDEDPADHDDRLGNVHVNVNNVSENWEGFHEQAFKIKKRMGSKRAYFFRGIAAMTRKDVQMSGEVIVSIEVLGRTEDESGGRMYTVGPQQWSRHYSPMMGRLAGTKDQEANDEKNDGEKATGKYNFQANQIQLRGPVPEELYHRYVEFKPFVQGMFTGKSLRGWLLNRALHHQHARIYNYDRTTKYGSFEGPCKEMTQQFLELTHYDEGGRIFTYVITLDGQFRFTETGKQFGIDLLSKHTMHSDVSIYIAFSGEFFIRRLKSPYKDAESQPEHPPDDISGGPPDSNPPKDPAYYHLIIDNDSGTYRPNNKLLPLLRDFLKSNFPGIKVSTLDCQGDADKMNKMKDEQREHRKAEGQDVVYAQMSDASSFSSSDEEDLNERAGVQKEKHGLGKKFSRHRHENHQVGEDAGSAGASRPTTKGVENHEVAKQEKIPEAIPSESTTAPAQSHPPTTATAAMSNPGPSQTTQTESSAPTFELQGSHVPKEEPAPIELPATTGSPALGSVEHKPTTTGGHVNGNAVQSSTGTTTA